MKSPHLGFAASATGNMWAALIAIVFTPLYIRQLGIEAFGLLAAIAAFQALVGIFDFGVGRTLARQMAQWHLGKGDAQSIRNLQFSSHVLYFTLAAAISAGITSAAPFVSAHWLRLDTLSQADVTEALRLAGPAITLRWLCSVHRSTLHGLSDHLWAHTNAAVFSTFRGLSTAAVVVYVSASLSAYLWVQLAISGCELALLMLRVRRKLPPTTRRATLSMSGFKSSWRFSIGVSAVAALTVLIAQLDRIALSRLVPLSELGGYALAVTLSGAVRLLFYPTSQALPGFTAFVQRDERELLIRAFHECCQILAVLLIPASVVLILFGKDVLTLWGGAAFASEKTAGALRWLVIGMLSSGLMTLLYALQLAHERTRTVIRLHTFVIIVYAPLLWLGIQKLGAQGAAVAWAVANVVYLAVGAPLLLRVFPRIELWRWARDDVLHPLLAALLIVGTIKLIVPQPGAVGSPAAALTILCLTGLAALVGTCFSTSAGRALLREACRSRFSRYVAR